ncbi:MAG: DUF975 family protein [Clostridia bacterium]|nr:DUF975 family protein [Clostridia bacterium]MBN2882243.1 DUF975 family protein [Clostridia bacterium]
MGNHTVNRENSEIRAESRKILQGNWGLGVAIILVVSILGGIGGSSGSSFSTNGKFELEAIFAVGAMIFGLLSILYTILVSNVINYGFSISFLNMGREGKLSFEDLFIGFKDYGRVVGMVFIKNFFIFLWSLLLIIPGIIKTYAYSMSDYILKDNPTLDSLQAITKSKEMMRGWKAKLFLLDLSLIGWWFLCIFTCGIGFLWLGSYYKTNHIVFYLELIGEDKDISEEPAEDDYIIEAAQKEIEKLNKEQQENNDLL